jgi:hypothetical protein
MIILPWTEVVDALISMPAPECRMMSPPLPVSTAQILPLRVVCQVHSGTGAIGRDVGVEVGGALRPRVEPADLVRVAVAREGRRGPST